MNKSLQEEINAGIWACAALLAFIAGFETLGWVIAFKAGLDVVCSMALAWVGFKAKLLADKAKAGARSYK